MALKRRQLDKAVRSITTNPPLKPAGGWIAAIRTALGMSGRQLAEHIGVTQPTLAQLERAESQGRISLDRLDKAARALNCHVVYAVVPDHGTFEDIIQGQAERRARAIVLRAANTMALEAQNIDEEEQRARVAELKDELLRSPRLLWSDSSEV